MRPSGTEVTQPVTAGVVDCRACTAWWPGQITSPTTIAPTIPGAIPLTAFFVFKATSSLFVINVTGSPDPAQRFEPSGSAFVALVLIGAYIVHRVNIRERAGRRKRKPSGAQNRRYSNTNDSPSAKSADAMITLTKPT